MAKRKKNSQTKPSAQKPPAQKPSSGAVSPAQLRRELKKLDRQIVALCHDRAALYKRLSELTEVDERSAPGAAEPTIDVAKAKGPLGVATLSAILRELESGSQALVRKTKVAFLGPEFSYSHLAAIRQFGHGHSLIPVGTIATVFESVDSKDADFGIVPLENSTDGRIVDTLEMFVRLPVRICGEIPMPIHHHLLAKCEQSEVVEVHSKPQALSQCRTWLAKNLPEARLVPSASTTAAAQMASTHPGVAAIASQQAGVEYGLQVLASAIEDNKHNVTRFAVIAREPAEPTGDDKTSLMFELKHQPGALADTMAVFKRNRLNLTWIESFPKKGSPHEYIFFVELLGHQKDLRVRRAVTALEKKTVKLEVLGSYPRREVVR